MQNILYFINKHIIISMIWIILFILVFITIIRNILFKKIILNHTETVNLVNKKKAILLDIRSYSNYCKGHITNSVNISKEDIKNKNLNKLKKYKNKFVIIVYDTKSNTNHFVRFLKKNGFQNIAILKGGINEWKNNNLPLVSNK